MADHDWLVATDGYITYHALVRLSLCVPSSLCDVMPLVRRVHGRAAALI